jgi:hypothetical protein
LARHPVYWRAGFGTSDAELPSFATRVGEIPSPKQNTPMIIEKVALRSDIQFRGDEWQHTWETL